MIVTPLKIYLIGFDGRRQKLIKIFIHRFCKDRCCIVSDKKQAEAFLVNIDSIGVEKELTLIKKQRSQTPIIHLALYTLDCDPHYFIRKPMLADNFLAILLEIEQLPERKIPLEKLAPTKKPTLLSIEKEKAGQVYGQLDKPKSTAEKVAHDINQDRKAEFAGESPDIDLSNKRNLAAIYFEPQRYFLFHFQQALTTARKNRSAIKLTGLGQTLIICPSSDCIYSSKSDKNVRSLCVVALYDNYQTEEMEITCEELQNDDLAIDIGDEEAIRKQAIEPFLWKLILWTARGRLPQGTDLDEPFQIQGWPNLTRLAPTPYAFRIIAYWMIKPRTLRETLDELGWEQRYVLSLYTAMLLTNQVVMTREDKQEVDPNNFYPNVAVKTKRLFSRLLKKLNTF